MGSVASLHGMEDISCLPYLAEHITGPCLNLIPAQIHSIQDQNRDSMDCSLTKQLSK